jgi:hypothetical protein
MTSRVFALLAAAQDTRGPVKKESYVIAGTVGMLRWALRDIT